MYMKLKGLKVGIATTVLLMCSGITHHYTYAAADQYEVKVYVDSDKVVKDNRHIKHDVLEALGSEDKDEDFNVAFLDNKERSNYKDKVTYRLQKSEKDKKYALQYKKRYPIVNNQVDQAIKQAKADGYNGDEFEVEYGENSQTLSVTKEAKADTDLKGLEMPNAAQSLTLFKSFATSPYKNKLAAITQPTLIGPVHFERHKGTINNHDIKIENWDVKNQNIVEISTKVKTEAEAKKAQKDIVNKLNDLGIHEQRDQLKTNLIFDNY